MEIFKVFGSIFLKGSDDVKKDLKDIDSTAEKSTGFSSLGKKVSDFSKNAGNKLGDFAKNVGKVAIGVGAGIATMAIAFGTMGVNGALELEATQAKFATVFGEFQDQANETYNQISKLTPMTKAQFNSMSSGIQDLLVPMGLSREEATGLTGDTMHLVGALTNFNSATHSAEDVSGAFQSALTGNTEGLKRLGIQVNAETINQKAYEMGLVEAGAEVDAASRAQALMALAYEQSGDALTAYNEESLDTKTKIELLKTQVSEFATGLAEKLLPSIMGLVDMAFPLLIDIMDALAPVFEFIIENLLPPLVDLITVLVGWITDFIEELTSLGKDGFGFVEPIIKKFSEDILPAIKEAFADLQEKIKEFVDAVVGAFKIFYEDNKEKIDKFQDILNLLIEVFTEEIAPIFMDTITEIKDSISEFVDKAIELFGKFYEDNKEEIDKLIGIIQTVLIVVIENLPALFEYVFGQIKNIFNFFKDAAITVIETVTGVFSGLIDFIDGVFTGDWDKAWSGVVKVFESIFNGIKGIAKGVINFLIRSINNFINGLNKIKIPDWVAGIGGAGINIPTIPLLAKGGNIMQAGQAIVGEAGPELIDLPQGARVTPLTDGQKGNVGLGGDTYNVNIYASDGTDVVEKVDRFLEDRKRRVPLPV